MVLALHAFSRGYDATPLARNTGIRWRTPRCAGARPALQEMVRSVKNSSRISPKLNIRLSESLAMFDATPCYPGCQQVFCKPSARLGRQHNDSNRVGLIPIEYRWFLAGVSGGYWNYFQDG